MRSAIVIARKAFAVLVTVVFALAIQPIAAAAPSHHAGMSQHLDCAAHCASNNHQSTPHKQHSNPCKDMANCGGVQTGSAMSAIARSNAVLEAPLRTAVRLGHTSEIGHGITLQPDNPPPIT